ncbi:MAG: hypothetical protein JSW01_03205 [Candidatus Bathyarchaeota archaeon]|nr:MAG: hypothetical protein JSW01_03205 [Candidatus Bathyarchaeota archaeon]
MVSAVLLNLSMEVIFGPENRQALLEHGWQYLIQHRLVGILIFYSIFNLAGTTILLKKDYGSREMGVLSLIIGFIFEFLWMRPDWVQDLSSLRITGGVIVAIIISAFYWFAAWGVPSRFLHRDNSLMKP